MKRLSKSDFIERATQLYGDKYDYSKVNFVNTSTKVCVICPEHGEFWIIPNNFLKGHKCPTCSGRQRITKEVFVSRSSAIHNGRYDYSKVEWNGAKNEVCIICPIHGEYWQLAKYHLQGNGCPKCFATPKSSTEDFIKKAKAIYGDKYDYSKVEYKGNKEKVCIICPEHGEWWMSPNNHLRGHRCPGCYGTPKHTNEEFVTLARKVHGNKYDYSKVEYKGNKEKVCIICPEHGEFWQKPQSHFGGNGCSVCSGMQKITLPLFIERCNVTHKGKYDYSKVNFKDLNDFVTIICPEHGEFEQRAKVHYRGYGCPICGGSKRLTNEEFIDKARLVHGNKYDYSKVEYLNTSTKVCIVCPEHGEFWQTPNNHLFGAGCPTCPQSNLEGEIRQLLIKNNIRFEQEKTFDWLVFNRKLFLDFFLPEYGVAIECQGGQHFFPTSLFGGEVFYQLTVERDNVKKDLCEKHGIKVLYYSNAHIAYPYPVFESVRLLLDAIRQRGDINPQQWNRQLELPL
jgi:hypothetical protein